MAIPKYSYVVLVMVRSILPKQHVCDIVCVVNSKIATREIIKIYHVCVMATVTI